MPVPPQLESVITAFGDVYRAAEARINAELASILDDDRQTNRRRRLRALLGEIERRTADLDGEAKAYLNNSLPLAWASGGSAASPSFSWTQPHRQALGLLATDNFDKILAANGMMSRDVKQLIRRTGAEAARFKVATGVPAKAAGRDLEERLRRQGISAVTYRDGRNIRASTYAEMLIRTSTALAYNLGSLNQLKADGVRYVEGVDGADCGLVTHGDPTKVNGKIWPVDVAATYAIGHPNCRRDYVSRPDVKSDEQAAVASSWRSKEQLDDQAAFERYLLAQQVRSQSRRAREPRQPRQPRGNMAA